MTSWMVFITENLKTLVWPVTIMYAVTVLRKSLRAALAKISQRIEDVTRIEAPGVKIELVKSIPQSAPLQTVETNVSISPPAMVQEITLPDFPMKVIDDD